MMTAERGDSIDVDRLRPLTVSDIDARVREAGSSVAGLAPGDDLRPRWITPRELVRRLSRFIVHN